MVDQLTSGHRSVFHRLPLSVLLPAAAAGTMVGTIMIAAHVTLLAAIGAGVAVTLLGTVRVRGRNIWRILGMRCALRWRKMRGNGIAAPAAPFDVPAPEAGGAVYGMRWDGGVLVTVLQVEPTGVAATLLAPTEIRTGDRVPLAEVVRCLSQFDIRLAAIDVLALGVRSRGNHDAIRMYERMLGPLPATATRTVWLALRFDPLDNAEAIGNRGGGTEGTVRTALVATRRVANRLARHGVRSRVLTAAEIAAADSTMLYGGAPEQWREEWDSLHGIDIEMTGYAVRPDRLNSEVLAGIWAVPGLSTLMRLRLAPAVTRAGARPSDERFEVTALVRHDTLGGGTAAARKALTALGLRPLTGVQRQVLLNGEQHPDAAYGPAATLQQLAVPAGGCGQVIGATAEGFGVAVPLFGPAVRRVEVVGSLRLAQQTTLRAAAIGARVIVHSTRPQDWEHMVTLVGVPEALSVSSPGGGAQHTAAATLIVYDGVASTGQVAEATVMHVRGPGELSAAILGADVVLVESEEDQDEVHVRTASGEWTVRVVSIPDELRYIGGADPAAAQQPLQPA
ncbi:type VII secretion protein EccE [Nocardia sp. alder85J]|uniref:type VII secretion protein EccE n=1 Tax=Nocardia sp. alder85J TaxID=2862949 RepID=UPI001CD7BA60|nr:type VII secretion protein EccE [Nocardia sp. alder85J]MCX4093085.1 type VII secretion protein EccE [Nocardia sp. alder85J]